MSSSGMKMLAFLLVFTMVWASGPAVNAQTPPATQPQAEKSKTPADTAFEPIARDFKNLYESLHNKGGIATEDKPAINSMRDRVAGFRKQFPNDVRGLGLELTIATWLKEDDKIDGLYTQAMKLAPDNIELRHAWVQRLKSLNRFTEAINVLQHAAIDPAKDPKGQMLLSDCLFSNNQFKEALDAMNAIPKEALDKDMEVKFQVDQARKLREDYVGLWAAEQSLRQQEESADDLPRALIITSKGSITVELFENDAPNTVANFISLADKGFYTGSKFHRVEPDVIQGGDPNTKESPAGTTTAPEAKGAPGTGNPGYYIPDEYQRDDHRNHFAGSLAMARTSAPNSAGCQFYLTPVPSQHTYDWNGKYCVFGRVLDGLDVVRNIKKDDVIQSITVIRKRNHEYVVSTLPLPTPATRPGAATKPATMPQTPDDESDDGEVDVPTSAPQTAPAAKP